MPYPTADEAEDFPWVRDDWGRTRLQNRDPEMDPRWYDEFSPEPEDLIPFAVGTTFVAIPYVVGGAIVLFAPPPMKPIGMAMLVPSPMDAVYFAAGYYVGEQFVQVIYD